ncbi:MAG: hypothetical protein WCN98_05345, partial [Verrucomicrobiaceae bacterium]
PLAELVKRGAELKSAARLEEMNKVISEIVDVTKIEDDVKKKLEEEAKAAVNRSLGLWKEKFDARLRPFLRNDVKESLDMLAQWPAEMLMKSGFVPESGKPNDQEEWKIALKKILTPEQLHMIDKIEGDRDEAKEKEIQDYLKPLLEEMRKGQQLALRTEADDVKSVLGLTGERAAKVDQIAADAVTRKTGEIEKRWVDDLRVMSDEFRTQFTMGRGKTPMMQEAEDESPEYDDISKSLREILSEDEQKRWEVASKARQARQDKALAMMFISHMDSKVLFTAVQREKLEPLAIKVMSTVTKNERNNIPINASYASKFNMEELKLVIDEKQLQHWKEASSFQQRQGMEDNGDTIENENAAGGVEEGEDAIMSAFFSRRDKLQRSRVAKSMIMKLEDIQRVAKPSEESVKRLEIASRGAAEHALDFWRPNFENWVRSSMQNVTAKTLKQRLAALSTNINFGEQGAGMSEQLIWRNAVADVLTASQKELWMNEMNGRKAYHDRASILMILAELDRRYHLSIDQFQKLEPLLTDVVAEYSRDFSRMFSGGGGDMPRYMIVFLAGVPEEKSKAILSPTQFDQWKKTDNAQLANWWENIKNMHDSRNRMRKTK